MQYNFKWDPAKAASNAKKHGITFVQAVAVFKDPMALSLYEGEDSALEEDRWVTLGLVSGKQYVVVVHTYQTTDGNMIIRVISARRATRQEVQQYEQG